MSRRVSDLVASAATALVALVVYLRTLAPSVGIIDSGELAAVASTLGIAHPTGYPLFTLLGRLFTMLPVASEEIVRLNVMAAVAVAAGVGVLCHLLIALFRRLGPSRGEARLRAAAVGGAMIFAFSETVWAQALAVEVYALHILLVALILRMTLHAMESADAPREAARGWYIAAYLLGLSFANHMTTVLLVPALVVLFAGAWGVGPASRRVAVRSAAWLAGGLSVYLYLPIRAAQLPVFSWGDVTSLERLAWHVSGKQYRVWIFSSWEVARRQLEAFVAGLPGELSAAALALAALGLAAALRRRWRAAMVSVLLAVTCVAYAINYDIHDIDSYFLLAYCVLAVWAAEGLRVLLGMLPRTAPGWIAWAGALVVPALMVAGSYRDADRSRDYMVEDYTRAVFDAVEPGGVILSYQWDFWLSASYYYQEVEGWRPDVAVVDKELLRRSWYLTELERRYPWLLEPVAGRVEAFRKEVAKFEHGLPHSGAVIQAHFVGMIRDLIRTAMRSRPVYVTSEIEPEFTAGLQRVPVGPVFRLHEDTLFHPTPAPEFSYRPIVRDDDYARRLRSLYAAALASRGSYYLAHGRQAEAEEAFRQASAHAPPPRIPGNR